MLCTAPALTIACLFFSELAAKFRSVEMAWHCTSSLSLNDSKLMSGCRKPDSMIGDSFCGWIETFRTHAAEERMSGRYVDCKRRRSEERPSALTISSWYFSATVTDQQGLTMCISLCPTVTR